MREKQFTRRRFLKNLTLTCTCSTPRAVSQISCGVLFRAVSMSDLNISCHSGALQAKKAPSPVLGTKLPYQPISQGYTACLGGSSGSKVKND